jgi:hypothetical protein
VTAVIQVDYPAGWLLFVFELWKWNIKAKDGNFEMIRMCGIGP